MKYIVHFTTGKTLVIDDEFYLGIIENLKQGGAGDFQSYSVQGVYQCTINLKQITHITIK